MVGLIDVSRYLWAVCTIVGSGVSGEGMIEIAVEVCWHWLNLGEIE